ncbi:MAG: LamG-like jellyroll fold domain-containing protein [Flavobacteriales bacterium]
MKKSLLFIFLNILVLLPFYAQTLSDSLVALYFLDGDGNDAVGSNNGTIIGATLTTDRNSNINSAYSFNGSGDWINIGNYTDLAITGDITVSAWVKTPNSWPSTYRDPHIYARNSDPISTIYGVCLYINNAHLTSRKFGFILKSGNNSWGNDFVVSNSILQLNTWYFIVGVRQDDVVKIYVNGTLEGTDIGSLDPINYGPSPSASIGQKDGTSPHWFNGTIDDVRIYKRALSTTEIQTLHTTISAIEFNDDINNQISVYPNPSYKYLNIKANESIDINRIEIFNISGQKIISKSCQVFKSNIQIDIDDLKIGTYFLKIFDSKNDFTMAKFLKLE